MLNIIVGAVVIGGLALALLDSETRNQHDLWQRKQGQLRRETAHQRERLQHAMQHSQDYQAYKQYIEMHYASVQTANQAFSLYQSAKHVLNSLYEQLKISGEKIQHLKAQRQHQTARELHATKHLLQQQYEIHKQIKIAIEQYRNQKNEYFNEVQKLNEATAQLKQYIRFNTGKAGREWYQRLELRRA